MYARYSDDKQNPASIEDQFRVCRMHAEKQGWHIVDTYQDPAISGASVILRPGVHALLADSQRGRFDIVLAEALDRVSRDQADIATLYKHLRFANVPMVTLAEGEITELHVGFKGTMNAVFLKDLAAKGAVRFYGGWKEVGLIRQGRALTHPLGDDRCLRSITLVRMEQPPTSIVPRFSYRWNCPGRSG